MKSNTDTDLASKIRQLRIDNNLTQEAKLQRHWMQPPVISAM